MFAPATWPGPLRPLVQRYGPAAVWLAGLKALGFPPSWATRYAEFEAVRIELESN
jgi:hypothetical protein